MNRKDVEDAGKVVITVPEFHNVIDDLPDVCYGYAQNGEEINLEDCYVVLVKIPGEPEPQVIKSLNVDRVRKAFIITVSGNTVDD